MRRGSQCRNVILIDVHVKLYVYICVCWEGKGKRGRQFSEVDWKANVQKFRSGGEWKAELTRQVSYAVHWSPSHFHPHLRNVKSCLTARIMLFFLLLYYWQWMNEKKSYFISISMLTNWVNLSIIFDLFGKLLSIMLLLLLVSSCVCVCVC